MTPSQCKGCYFWIQNEGLCAYYGSSYPNVPEPCDMRREGSASSLDIYDIIRYEDKR